jgi:hypothetical protein
MTSKFSDYFISDNVKRFHHFHLNQMQDECELKVIPLYDSHKLNGHDSHCVSGNRSSHQLEYGSHDRPDSANRANEARHKPFHSQTTDENRLNRCQSNSTAKHVGSIRKDFKAQLTTELEIRILEGEHR